MNIPEIIIVTRTFKDVARAKEGVPESLKYQNNPSVKSSS